MVAVHLTLQTMQLSLDMDPAENGRGVAAGYCTNVAYQTVCLRYVYVCSVHVRVNVKQCCARARQAEHTYSVDQVRIQ